MISIPNLISLSRVPLAVAFLLLPDRTTRALLIGAAALTDFLDGWWARRFHAGSRTGEIVDPLADKLFLLSAILAYTFAGALSVVETVVVLARDVIAALGALLVVVRKIPFRLRARWSGKVATVAQIALVFVLLIAPAWTRAAVIIAAMAGVYTIVDYTLAVRRALRPAKPPH